MEAKVVHDDNVYRLSPAVDPVPLIGASERSDTYSVATAGINLDLPLSRQRLLAAFSVNQSHYQRFSVLDSTGHDARANWLWRAGDEVSGELGYTDTSALASFANLVGTAPDRLRSRHAFVRGAYQATPRWRLGAGADGNEQRNSDPAHQVNDVDILTGELSLSYVSPAGSSLGLSAGGESGRFPNPQPVDGTLVDNAYRQNRVGLVAQWLVTAVSRLDGRIDRVGRHYEELPQRNFDGTTWRLQYEWKPGVKIALTLLAQHDISPFEYVRSSFVLVKGVSLRPAYRATPKLDLSAALDLATRDYLGDPAVALGASPLRSDRVRSAGALVSYRPLPTTTVQMSLLRETRSSNIPFNDYTANVVSLSGRLAF